MKKINAYILYKNPISVETLDVVRFLYAMNIIDARATTIIERNYPPEIITRPSIYDTESKILYSGLDECVKFFEEQANQRNLLKQASSFMKDKDFRINDLNY
jgi:hypothetical protein